MRVLLVNADLSGNRAPARRYNRAWPPLDLLNLAAIAREKGHEAQVIDLRARPERLREAKRAARASGLVVLTTAPMDRWQCPDLAWEAARPLVQALGPERTLLIGTHVTLEPELLLSQTQALAGLVGEPEAAFGALLAAWPAMEQTPGLARMTPDGLKLNPAPAPVDLAELPDPAYALVDIDDYGYPLLGRRLLLLEAARGCPFECSFCLKAMYPAGVRRKGVEQITGQIQRLTRLTGSRTIYFMDLEFTLKRDWVWRFCQELIKLNLGLRWSCQTRVDTVDEDLLGLMKRAGAVLIHFGVETGSPRLLEATGKKITHRQAARAVGWAQKAGIETACFFLLGLPGETPAERGQTMRLARRLGTDYASFHLAAPYPGTRLASQAGGQDPFAPSIFTGEELAELGRQARRAYRRFYLRPGYAFSLVRRGGLGGLKAKLKLFKEFAS